MRCRFCGSNSLHEDTQHKNFSAGKAVAGTVVFGVYGAAAGFIGKEKKGYRCGACGQFMDAPMDFLTESNINIAIREAESGSNRGMFDYYKKQYPNIQANLPAVSPSSSSAPAQEIVYQPVAAVQEGATIKHSYRYGKWQPECPIWVEGVIIKSRGNSDYLSLAAWNLSEKAVRSAYFSVKVFDDTGDIINESSFVYQSLSVNSAEKLPEETEFPLNTNFAYRAELKCEKVAFSDDEVWRNVSELRTYNLPEQPELTGQNFTRLKYVDSEYAKMNADQPKQLKMPMKADGFWMCCCGMPVPENQSCIRCKDTFENEEKCFSQPYLLERQQQVVKERAAKRTAEFEAELKNTFETNYSSATEKMNSAKTEDDFLSAAKIFDRISNYRDSAQLAQQCKNDSVYAFAKAQMEKGNATSLGSAIEAFGKIPEWRDSKEQIKICADRIDAIDRANKLKAEQEKAAKAKKTRIQIIIVVAVSVILMLIPVISTIANSMEEKRNNYSHAEYLYDNGDYAEAQKAFEELGGYKDSKDRAADSKEKNEEKLKAEREQEYKDILEQIDKRNYNGPELEDRLKALGDYENCKELLAELEVYNKAVEHYYDNIEDKYYVSFKALDLLFKVNSRNKYVKLPDGWAKIVDFYAPFIGTWEFSKGDNKILSYYGSYNEYTNKYDSSKQESIKKFVLKYSDADGMPKMFMNGKRYYGTFMSSSAIEENTKTLTINYRYYTYTVKNKDTLRIEYNFAGKKCAAEYTRTEKWDDIVKQ